MQSPETNTPNLKVLKLEFKIAGLHGLILREKEGYSAEALNLPGVVSQGQTIDGTIRNLQEAFIGAIATYIDNKMPIPYKKVRCWNQ